MRIGVFSDDAAGPATALLIAHGLAGAGAAVEVAAEPSALPLSRGGAKPRVSHVDTIGTGALLDTMRAADGQGRDLILALPIDCLRDGQLRVALDAVVTVGRDHPASARAMGAARFDAWASGNPDVGDEGPRPAPPWFLPCSHQVHLWTQASLAASGPVPLPFATRLLPFMAPRLGQADIAVLAGEALPPAILRTAVLVASLVVAVAADPHARRIEAATLAALMAARELERERRISDRLLALSAEFERLEGVDMPGRNTRAPSLPPARRRPGASRTSGVVRHPREAVSRSRKRGNGAG
jgi:hypothetical protein